MAWNRNHYQLTSMETQIGWKRFQGAGLWNSRGNFHLVSEKDGAWEMPARVTLSSLVGMEGSQVSQWCASQWGNQAVSGKWQDMMQLRVSWVHCGHCLVSWPGKKKKEDKRHHHYMFHFLAVVLSLPRSESHWITVKVLLGPCQGAKGRAIVEDQAGERLGAYGWGIPTNWPLEGPVKSQKVQLWSLASGGKGAGAVIIWTQDGIEVLYFQIPSVRVILWLSNIYRERSLKMKVNFLPRKPQEVVWVKFTWLFYL